MTKLLFSTILFIEGNPVCYEFFEKDGNYLLFPLYNPHSHTTPPELRLVKVKLNEYTLEGTTDKTLIDQVLEKVKLTVSLPKDLIAK